MSNVERKRPVGGEVPVGAYSPGMIIDGRLLYVTGQGPLVEGVYVPGTLEEETRTTLESVGNVLREAGATYADVVRCGVYLADIRDFDLMDRVYSEYFPDPQPARTTIGAPLWGQTKITIDCVAVLP